jgi:hypothetical protein
MTDWHTEFPAPEPVIDWAAVKRERKRRGWVHFTAGGDVPTEGAFAWIVMSQIPYFDPTLPKWRDNCGHLLDFDTARCTACGQEFARPGFTQWGSYGIGIVVQYLPQGEALYHEECAPVGWNQPYIPALPKPTPDATQPRLF